MKKILSIKDSIIAIQSEKGHAINQVVIFDKKITGLILKTSNEASFVVVDYSDSIKMTSSYTVQSKPWSIEFDQKMVGSIIDVYGQEVYSTQKFKSEKKIKYPSKFMESKAPMFSERLKLNKSLETGIFSVDTLIPIGKGQRELIIGDRKTGKTSIALSSIINQKNKDIKVIYASIGQKQTSLSDTFDILKNNEALSYTTIISATPDLKLSQYVVPYLAMALAESIAAIGQDVLIVFDDLSKHANIIREISLNLNKSGGREAYPSDLFYLHSKLLERAGKFEEKLGGGTITALPILETVEGDFNTLLATNLISITDGQIVTNSQMAKENKYPAIDVGMSVSRTGSGVQNKLIKLIAKDISKIFAQYIESKKYELISVEISEKVKNQINKGKLLSEAFIQNGYVGISSKQMFIASLLIEFGTISNLNMRVSDFVSLAEQDPVGKKILNQIDFKNKASIELFKNYCKMVSGIDNKWNAKRFLKGVSNE